MRSAAARRSTTIPVAWVDLGVENIDAVYELHLAATAEVGRPDLVRPETRAFFEEILTGGGRICGHFDSVGLLAYGVLQWQLPPEENLRSLFGLRPAATFAKLAGAAVRPGAWGRGLHDAAIVRRVELAGELGFRHLYATSAPGNWRSWTNLVDQHFAIRAVRQQYGGQMRYIVYRNLDIVPDHSLDGMWCSVDDLDAQRRCLADGLEGREWRMCEAARREILFGPVR
jgi:hypothetical protein